MSSKIKHVFPFTEWELVTMSGALSHCAERAADEETRHRMLCLARRLQLAKPGIVAGPRRNATYARKEKGDA